MTKEMYGCGGNGAAAFARAARALQTGSWRNARRDSLGRVYVR